jgi:hypothetical protein
MAKTIDNIFTEGLSCGALISARKEVVGWIE